MKNARKCRVGGCVVERGEVGDIGILGFGMLSRPCGRKVVPRGRLFREEGCSVRKVVPRRLFREEGCSEKVVPKRLFRDPRFKI